MLWSAKADTATVVLTSLPRCLSDERNLAAILAVATRAPDIDGTHLLQPIGDRALHLIRLPDVEVDAALAALVPLDPSGPDRLVAVDQLLRALLSRPVPPDRRLTRQQRRRLRHMLQACDGRENGATYREIANVLFGQSASPPTPGSPRRCATRRWRWCATAGR